VICPKVGLQMSQVAHQACAYPGFHRMKQLGVILLPCGWDASLYNWVERGTARVACFAQERNTLPWRGLEPGPLNLEPSNSSGDHEVTMPP